MDKKVFEAKLEREMAAAARKKQSKCYRVWFGDSAVMVDAHNAEEAENRAKSLLNRSQPATKIECLSITKDHPARELFS